MNFQQHKEKRLKNSKVKKEYEKLGPEFPAGAEPKPGEDKEGMDAGGVGAAGRHATT